MKYLIWYSSLNTNGHKCEHDNLGKAIKKFGVIDQFELDEVYKYEIFFRSIRSLFTTGPYKNKNISLMLKDKHVYAIFYMI